MITSKKDRVIRYSKQYSRIVDHALTDGQLDHILSLELNNPKLVYGERIVISNYILSVKKGDVNAGTTKS